MAIAPLYENAREVFYEKFLEVVNIKELTDHHLVHLEALALTSEDKWEIQSRGLTREEIILYCLMKLGMTPQELSIVYGIRNVNTIYVRCHRIRKKLKAGCNAEILVVSIVVLFLIFLALCILGI